MIDNNFSKLQYWNGTPYGLDYRIMACHPGITWKFIKTNWVVFRDYWDRISLNPNITIDIVKKDPDLWCWEELSVNINISPYDILNNLELPWNWDQVSLRRDIPIDMIIKNQHLPWNWKYISNRLSINPDLDTIINNPHLPWDLREIFYNDFGFDKKSNEYYKISNQIRDLTICYNEILPKYLMLEFIKLHFISSFEFLYLVN